MTLLREGLPGFIFESNRGVSVNITPDHPLGAQCQFSWTSKVAKKMKSKAELMTEKVGKLALELQGKYFSVAQESTRRVAAELRAILASVEAACTAHDQDSVSGWG